MLNREEIRRGSPETGPGSSEKPKVNTLLVENFVSLLAAFSPAERQAVFKAIMAMPDFPVRISKDQLRTRQIDSSVKPGHESNSICAPPEKEKSPTPPMAGWMGTSSLAIVDFCKRIEFCYQEFQRIQRKLSKQPYIDFRATQNLAQEIIEYGGIQALQEYVEHLESIFQSEIWWGFNRPERMRQHWQSYVQKAENQPASH